MKTVTVRVLHKSSIPGAYWVSPVGWEPTNKIDGAEYVDGSWWDDYEEVAGMVWFGGKPLEPDGMCPDHWAPKIEVKLCDLRVASCGDCHVMGHVST